MRRAAVGRFTAAAALSAVIVVVLLVVRSGSAYTIRADFLNASQLVNGDLVQVGGTAIGKVAKIELTPNGAARLTLRITDADYAPLRRGTRFTVREASLSGIANRYVDLTMPPGDEHTTGTYDSGAIVPTTETTSAVDLDQLFNVFGHRERVGLRDIIRGSASQYAKQGEAARVGFQYLNPAVASSSALFEELNRDTPKLRRYIEASASLVHTIAQRRNDLSGLVDRLGTTVDAIRRPPGALGLAIRRLPPFMRRADTTFVNLRATLDDLRPLVRESKPVARRLVPYFAALRPLAADARPTVRDLSAILDRPGPNNDLVELTKGTTRLAGVTVRNVKANGKTREGAFPATTRALSTGTPELAYARPYAVDLTGWFDDFSHTGVYDAIGSASRVSPVVNAFSVQQNGDLLALPPSLRDLAFGKLAAIDQYDRCPGSDVRPTDGSTPYKPSADYPCDPTQIPPGK